MNIESCAMTFELDRLFDITASLFVDAVNENGRQLELPYNKSALFLFYEDSISYPIDDLKDGEDEVRLDFYEVISLMSWAFYRVWVRIVVDENHQLDCFSEIPKNDVIELFMDNINCEEGRSLLDMITGDESNT